MTIEKELIICGLSVPPDMPAMRVSGVEIRWTVDALRSFERLRTIGEKIGKPELPYRSLSWLAEMGCAGIMIVDASAGLKRNRVATSLEKLARSERTDPVMWIDLDKSLPSGADQVARLHELVSGWLDSEAFNTYFAPLENSQDRRDQTDIRRRMIGAVADGRMMDVRPFNGYIAPWTRALTADVPVPYELLRARLQHLLSGRELFPDAGPSRRILTPRSMEYADLTTSPITLDNMSDFSLTTRLSIVTIPGVDHPILKVEASRRRWTANLPDYPGRNSNANGLAFPADRVDVAYRFNIAKQFTVEEVNGKEKKTWTWVPTGDFHEMRRHFRETPISEVADILSGRADSAKCRYRVGYHASYGRSTDDIVKSGVPETDRMALLERVTQTLGEHGLKPFSKVKSLSATTRKAKGKDVQDFIQPHGLGWMLEALDQLEDDGMVDHSELARMSESDIRAAMRRHMESTWADATKLSPPVPGNRRDAAARVVSRALQAAHAAMVAIYGTARPLLMIFHHESKDALDSARVAGVWAKVMTGDVIDTQIVPLPKDVHGPVPFDLGTKRRMARDKRVAIWEAAWHRSGWPAKLAQMGATRPILCLMIVPQFIDTGETKAEGEPKFVKDDHVAKLITRKVLASIGRATVQYLLPARSGRPINMNERLHQVQSALRDLIWAHAGRVDGLAQIVSGIADPTRRPQSIVGIFVQASNGKLIFSKHGFFLPLATRLDVSTGQCFLSWMLPNGTMAPWVNFREGLFRIAGLDGMSAEQRGNARAAFQHFVRSVVDSVRSERPLVMIDATHTRNLWTWLTNPKIGQGLLTMDGQDHVTHGWNDVRILRVDGELGLRVISKKPVHVDLPDGGSYDYNYATTDKEFLAINPDGPAPVFYSVVRHLGYGQPKRGQSCYRSVVMEGEKATSDGEDPSELITKIEDVEKTYGTHTRTMRRGLYKYPPIGDKNASLPVSVEITVGFRGRDDDPVVIARMAHELREAMAHYIDAVKLPPPLYLKRIVKDYAIGLELKGERDEDDDVDDA